MSTNGDAAAGAPVAWFAGYSQLDKKVDSLERDIRAELGSVNNKIDNLGAQLLDRMDRNSQQAATASQQAASHAAAAARPSSPYQLIGTAIGIITLLGTAFTYVTNNISTNQQTTIAALDKETQTRIEGERRIYDYVGRLADKAWTRDSQTEFERRIDERDRMEQVAEADAFARIDKDHDSVVASIVPRAEHAEQWQNQRETLDHVVTDLSKSLDRIADHLNQSDLRFEAKLGDLEKVVHGYGLADEVKDMQTDIKTLSSRLFGLVAPPNTAPAPAPAGGEGH